MDVTTPRTYGALTIQDGIWYLKTEPHVTIRVKRMFPKMSPNAQGVLWVSDTLDTCRDLGWLLTRWPLRMKQADRDYLDAQVDKATSLETSVAAIQGGLRLGADDWLEPATTPRDYQLAAADLALATGRVIVVHSLGLGKTYTSLLVLRNPKARPAMAVTLGGIMPAQWVRQVHQHFPGLTATVAPTGEVTDRVLQTLLEADVVVLPYSRLAKYEPFLRGHVKTAIFDEVQELRHEGSAKYNAAASIAGQADFRIGVTGTLIYGYAGETWDISEVHDPGVLGTKTEFTREWGAVTARTGSGVSIADAGPLGAYMREIGLMDVKSKADAGLPSDAPDIQQFHIDVDPDVIDAASKDLTEIAEKLLEGGGTRQEQFGWEREMDWRMRQATGLAKAVPVAELVKLMLESERRVLLFGWHHECFAAGTQTLMADGTSKSVEDVAVGDRLMGPDSRPRTVQNLTRGNGRMFRVVPHKGEPWVCSEHHLLTVWNGRRYEKWTAGDFASRPPRWQRDRLLYRASAVTFEGSQPAVEPWLMGYWIGDGALSLRDLRVSSADPEVETEMRTIAARHGLSLSSWAARGASGTSNGRQLAFSSGTTGPKGYPLMRHFRAVCSTTEKRIPPLYMTAPIDDRRELLAGLIDSDGHVHVGNGVGTATYTAKGQALAEDVAFVARSLGLAAYVKAKERSATGYATDNGGHWSITISGDLGALPTRIARKRAGNRAGQKDVLRTGFQIEEVAPSDFYGFGVDEDHLFLLNDFTVVHNCYDVWSRELGKYYPVKFTGAETEVRKMANIRAFTDPKGETRVCMMSVRAGAGIDGLQQHCAALVIGELDWSPGVHQQNIGRLDRPGQTRPVFGYIATTDYGSDPAMTEVLGLKRREERSLAGVSMGTEQAKSNGDRIRLLAEAVLKRRGVL